MWIVVDMDEHGTQHTIDTDPAHWPKVGHPNGSGLTTVDVMLQYLSANPSYREAGGWNIANEIYSETSPTTRWQRLVREANGPDATAQAKSLGLVE